jgi:hypothetical protein
MGLLSKLFGKKEAPEEFDMGKFPDMEAPVSQAPPGMGSAPGGPGLTEMPGGMPGEMPVDIGNAPPAPLLPMRGQPPSAFAPAPVMQSPAMPDISRDMQVVNAKLDTLKVLLDSINAKLDRIEQRQPKEEEPISLSVKRWR